MTRIRCRRATFHKWRLFMEPQCGQRFQTNVEKHCQCESICEKFQTKSKSIINIVTIFRQSTSSIGWQSTQTHFFWNEKLIERIRRMYRQTAVRTAKWEAKWEAFLSFPMLWICRVWNRFNEMLSKRMPFEDASKMLFQRASLPELRINQFSIFAFSYLILQCFPMVSNASAAEVLHAPQRFQYVDVEFGTFHRVSP